MIKKAFITGITGQDGSYLAELLLKNGSQYESQEIINLTFDIIIKKFQY